MFQSGEKKESAFVSRLRKKYLSESEVLTEEEFRREFEKYFAGAITVTKVRVDENDQVVSACFWRHGSKDSQYAAERVFKTIFRTDEDSR